MWPLSASEVAQACNGKCSLSNLNDIFLTGISSDSRNINTQELFIAIPGEKFDGHNFVEQVLKEHNILAMVEEGWFSKTNLSPNYMDRCIVVTNTLQAFRDLAKFMRSRFSFPVIGIGGSNGKTTTKEMLAALLSGSEYLVSKTAKSENGFLGVALTICHKRSNIKNTPHVLVLEIGIDEPGAMQSHIEIGKPDIVLLTALGPEHISGLGSWENAIQEELKLFSLNPQAKKVWQSEEPALLNMLKTASSKDVVVCQEVEFANIKNIYSSNNTPSILTYKIINSSPLNSKIQVNYYLSSNLAFNSSSMSAEFTIPMPGKHNVRNFCLALGTALVTGRTLREAEIGWNNFIIPEMRSNLEELNNGCTLYNDCYNASPASMTEALTNLSSTSWQNKNKIAILGDMLELGVESKHWHLKIAESLGNIPNLHLCLYGSEMRFLYDLLSDKQGHQTYKLLSLTYLPKEQDPCNFLKDAQYSLQNSVILVKGSRGMKLDRVVNYLKEGPTTHAK